jgi:RNA polymerase sigma factor (sigma-70 family)
MRSPTQRSVSLAEIESAYRSHAHHVQRRAAFVLGNDTDAVEVVQEVFLSLIDHPEQFAARSALSTWLYRATLHRCFNRLRDQRTRARLMAERTDELPLPRASSAPEHVVELRSLLLRLPDELAEVAVYQLADELTQSEIAEVMGCSRRRVRDLIEQLERALAAERVAAS